MSLSRDAIGSNRISSDLGSCLLTGAVAFLLVPVLMIGSAPEEFGFLQFSVFFGSAIALATLLAGVLFGICVALRVCRLARAAEIFITFVLWWTLIAGFFLPVSVSSGMVDPEHNAVDSINLAVVFLLAGMACLLRFTPARKYLHVFAGVVVLTSVLPAVVAVYSIDSMHTTAVTTPVDSEREVSGDSMRTGELTPPPPPPPLQTRHTSLDISNKRNILVVSFDGLPGHIIGKVIRQSPTFSEVFRDFIFFDNVISQSPGTEASQLGELFGVIDFKAKGSDIKEVTHTLRSEGAVDALPFNQAEDGFMWGYRFLGRWLPSLMPEHMSHLKTDTVDFFRYAIVRMWTRLPLKLIEWENWVSPARKLMGASHVADSLVARMIKHNGPAWDKQYILQINEYRSVVSQLAVADKPLSVRYLHYVFTHFPVDFDASCEYRSDDPEWHHAHQNEAGLEKQSRCALSLYAALLHKLKTLGVYDETLVVFKSDHGEPSDYYSSPPYNLRLNGSTKWGYSRYRPTLMIKDFDRRQEQTKYRSELVLLNDLANTLCRKYPNETDCERYPGMDLFATTLHDQDPYYIYVARDSKSDFRFGSHLSLEVPSRRLSLLEAFEQSALVDVIQPAANPPD